jgi:hypothetical protein
VKSEQKKELENLKQRKLLLSGELNASEAENMLPDFVMGETNMQGSPEQKASLALTNAPHSASPPSGDAGVDQKVEAFRKQSERKEQEMRQKLLQKELEKEENKNKREAEKVADKLKKTEFKNSAQGRAEEYLKGIQRDTKRANELIRESGVCGMKAGFAREWKACFQKIVKCFGEHERKMIQIKDGTCDEDPNELLECAKKTAEQFKTECKNFTVAKGFFKEKSKK